ncbi:hypothetical protein DAI22_03g310300 [Oryza sativa Japonica Group]|nr:hypothetical protein DAI22_03g310300 [Oryza sativa Japonica Group]
MKLPSFSVRVVLVGMLPFFSQASPTMKSLSPLNSFLNRISHTYRTAPLLLSQPLYRDATPSPTLALRRFRSIQCCSFLSSSR